MAYLRKRVSSLEREKAGLDKEKTQLLQQLDYWKKRFKELLGDYRGTFS